MLSNTLLKAALVVSAASLMITTMVLKHEPEAAPPPAPPTMRSQASPAAPPLRSAQPTGVLAAAAPAAPIPAPQRAANPAWAERSLLPETQAIAERLHQEPDDLRALADAQGQLPAPVVKRLEAISSRTQSLARALELSEEQAAALEQHFVHYVAREAQVIEESRLPSGLVFPPPQLGAWLHQETLTAIQQDPRLGAGMAKVADRFLPHAIRDPAAPVASVGNTIVSVSEMRSLAREK